MSNRKEFKWANVQTNGTAKNFGGWDAGGNPVEIPPASSGDITAGTDDQKPITAATLTAYIAALLASETVKGIVEEATDAEVLAGTSVGATLAKLFLTPTKLHNYRSLTDIAAAVSAGTLNLNFGNQSEASFNVATTIAANCTVTVTETNGKVFLLKFAVTGTVVITMPSTFKFESGEVAIGRWNSSTKVLTLIGTTDTEYEIVGAKRGSVWRCISSKYE